MCRIVRVCTLAILCLFLGCLANVGASAQDWQSATVLPGIDLNGLTPAQKASVLRVMRAQGCSCGCDMRMAECRVKDPTCSYSKGMAEVVISSIKAGKSEQEAFDAAKASRWGHIPEAKLLDDPVSIPLSGAPSIGPANAKIVIIEFSDFQCPYCVQAVPQIQALLKAYPNDARLVFKQFPLEIHSRAFLAASSALAANKQGKFWQMHDGMFEHHNELSRETFTMLARSMGMDMEQFEKDLDSDEIKKEIQKDVDDGDRAGVQGTPTIFINGQRYNGPITLNYLKPIFDAALKVNAKTQTAAVR
jgi:protein-disulfide isomerase